MKADSYLVLLEKHDAPPPNSPFYESQLTNETFSSYEQYLAHAYTTKYEKFLSVFGREELQFQSALQFDLEVIFELERLPFSYILAHLVAKLRGDSLPKNTLLVLPGDVVAYAEKQYVIVGSQDGCFIGKEFRDFNLTPSFNAEIALVLGKLALFSSLAPLNNPRKDLPAVQHFLAGSTVFDAQAVEKLAKCSFESENEAANTIFDCLHYVMRQMTAIKRELCQFKFFATKSSAKKLCEHEQLARLIAELVAMHGESHSEIAKSNYYSYAKINQIEALDEEDSKAVKRKPQKSPGVQKCVGMCESELQFEEYLDSADQAKILYELQSERRAQKQQEKQEKLLERQEKLQKKQELDGYVEQCLMEQGVSLNEKLLAFYCFFYTYHKLLKMELCSFEQFEEAWQCPTDKLYNGNVVPIQYQLICRLMAVLNNKDEVLPSLYLEKVNGRYEIQGQNIENQGAEKKTIKTEKKKAPESDYSDNDEESEEYSEESGSEEAGYEQEENSYYSYGEEEYGDEEDDISASESTEDGKGITKKKPKNIEQSESGESGLSASMNSFIVDDEKYEEEDELSDDYVITNYKRKKYQLRDERRKQPPKEDNALASLEAIDATNEQFQNEEMETLELKEQENNGSEDAVFVSYVLEYVLEVSFPQKDLFALEFICPLLNHLTDKFDDVFHELYKKLDNYEYYELGKFEPLKYIHQHNLMPKRVEDYWNPSYDYPIGEFMEYAKLLGYEYDISDESLQKFKGPLVTRLERHSRYDQIYSLIKQHHTTKFALLPDFLRHEVIDFLICRTIKCQCFINFQRENVFEDELLKDACCRLSWINKKSPQIEAEFQSSGLGSFNEYLQQEKEKACSRISALHTQELYSNLIESCGCFGIVGYQMLKCGKAYIKSPNVLVEVDLEQLESKLSSDEKFLAVPQEIPEYESGDKALKLGREVSMQQLNELYCSEGKCLLDYGFEEDRYGALMLSRENILGLNLMK